MVHAMNRRFDIPNVAGEAQKRDLGAAGTGIVQVRNTLVVHRAARWRRR
jgi:hypothetical protein